MFNLSKRRKRKGVVYLIEKPQIFTWAWVCEYDPICPLCHCHLNTEEMNRGDCGVCGKRLKFSEVIYPKEKVKFT